MGFYYSDDIYLGCDVKDREIIVFDNIIRTGQKIRSRIRDLQSRGAKDIYCFAAHGLSPGDELNRIVDEEGIKELILTNSLQQSSEMKRVRYISVGKLLA